MKPSAILSMLTHAASPFFTTATGNNTNLRCGNSHLRKFSSTPIRYTLETSTSASEPSQSIVGDLLDYLNESWTQFHATGMYAASVVSQSMRKSNVRVRHVSVVNPQP